MEYIRVVLIALPRKVHGFTVCYPDTEGEFYTIFLNAHDSSERQRKTYDHEIEHINNGDFDKMLPIEELEAERHEGYRNVV